MLKEVRIIFLYKTTNSRDISFKIFKTGAKKERGRTFMKLSNLKMHGFQIWVFLKLITIIHLRIPRELIKWLYKRVTICLRKLRNKLLEIKIKGIWKIEDGKPKIGAQVGDRDGKGLIMSKKSEPKKTSLLGMTLLGGREEIRRRCGRRQKS